MTNQNKPNTQQQKGPAKQATPKYRQAWRPKVKEIKGESLECPYCHASIKSGLAICPECGRSLTPEKCSFCGAPMKPKAKFCTHCGQSREGVTCPECGTLNSRNFCRKCNAPLTPMGQQALEAAKKDPAFKAVQKKANELAELQRQIDELQKQAAEPNLKPAELSEEDKALLNEYAALLSSIGTTEIKATQTKTEETAQRKTYTDPAANLQDIMAAYREKAVELDAELASMVPPPDFTPEQQRDYYSARKVMTLQKEYNLDGYVPYMWKCNLCGMLHRCPPECAEPELGGVWVHISVEQYIEENPDAYTLTATIE